MALVWGFTHSIANIYNVVRIRIDIPYHRSTSNTNTSQTQETMTHEGLDQSMSERYQVASQYA